MSEHAAAHITVAENGPYLVTGEVPVTIETMRNDSHESSWTWEVGASVPVGARYALCRCGESAKKPFCDGTHTKIGFDGTETASRASFKEQAKVLDGPGMVLEDADTLCAFARFCDNNGGIWKSIGETDDAGTRDVVRHEATHCPSGRLVVHEHGGVAIEPPLTPSIALAQDPEKECSGPLWVRGGIAITAADGGDYEVRNRVTLCRCGKSQNKPFCDGTHADVAFRDGL